MLSIRHMIPIDLAVSRWGCVVSFWGTHGPLAGGGDRHESAPSASLVPGVTLSVRCACLCADVYGPFPPHSFFFTWRAHHLRCIFVFLSNFLLLFISSVCHKSLWGQCGPNFSDKKKFHKLGCKQNWKQKEDQPFTAPPPGQLQYLKAWLCSLGTWSLSIYPYLERSSMDWFWKVI